MKTTPNQSRRPQPARPHLRIDYPHENHLDRELRKMRGLSTEVGQACNAWLASRGIFSRTWERSSPRRTARDSMPLDFSLPNDL